MAVAPKRTGKNDDARASLDRAKKTFFSESTDVKICDQKRRAEAHSKPLTRASQLKLEMLQSTSRPRRDSSEYGPIEMAESITATDTNEACLSTYRRTESSSHQLVRRYTEDLDHECIKMELQRAKRSYQKGRKLFAEQNFFDCLECLSKALDSFNTTEQPSANLKAKLPSVYKTVKDCYLLSASCYIRMDQQDHAKLCLKIILDVEPSDAQTLFLRGQANEIRQETSHKSLADYQRAYQLTVQQENGSQTL